MQQRDMLILACGVALGYAVGYTICWWNRPIPQLVNKETGVPKTKTVAKILLDTESALDRMKPTLKPLAEGGIPSPRDLFMLVKEVA
jgi:hypothetical protein